MAACSDHAGSERRRGRIAPMARRRSRLAANRRTIPTRRSADQPEQLVAQDKPADTAATTRLPVRFRARSTLPALAAAAFVAVGYLLGLELESMALGFMGACLLFLISVAVLTSFGGSSAGRR